MVAELIFLVIMAMGLLLVGIGLVRRTRRGLLGGYRGAVVAAHYGISRAYQVARGGYSSYRRFAGGYQPLNDQERHQLQQQIGQIATQGEAQRLTQGEIEQQIRSLPLFQRNERTRNLQGGISQYHPGGAEGEGIYGERSGRDSVYGELKYVLRRAGIPHPLKSFNDLVSGWLDRRRRREENQEE